MERYMGTKTYANVVQQANQIPQDSTPIDKYKKKTYRNFIDKLKKKNEWPRFKENLKKNVFVKFRLMLHWYYVGCVGISLVALALDI